jgi:hypothetical protein
VQWCAHVPLDGALACEKKQGAWRALPGRALRMLCNPKSELLYVKPSSLSRWRLNLLFSSSAKRARPRRPAEFSTDLLVIRTQYGHLVFCTKYVLRGPPDVGRFFRDP